jgi:hypothetical protein
MTSTEFTYELERQAASLGVPPLTLLEHARTLVELFARAARESQAQVEAQPPDTAPIVATLKFPRALFRRIAERHAARHPSSPPRTAEEIVFGVLYGLLERAGGGSFRSSNEYISLLELLQVEHVADRLTS